MRKHSFTLLFCFFIAFNLNAYSSVIKRPIVKIPAKINLDTSSIQMRSFNGGKIHAYLQDKDFRYNKADVEGESLWDRFWNWFWHWLDEKVFPSEDSHRFFYYLLIAFGVIFLLYVAFKITGINVMTVLGRSAKKIEVPYSETLENIHELKFDEEIEKAISAHNYRLAVRLLYLYSLKQLNDAGLIHWQIEKTNSAYLNEMPAGEKRRLFSLLTMQFEYVWYGNFYIDVNSFQEINTLFNQLNKK